MPRKKISKPVEEPTEEETEVITDDPEAEEEEPRDSDDEY